MAKPFATRFIQFFTLKKRRIFYMLMLYALWNYWPRLSNWARNKKQRVINKYRRRWIAKYNPSAV